MLLADFYQLLLRDLIEASSASQASDLQQQLRSARRQSGKAGESSRRDFCVLVATTV